RFCSGEITLPRMNHPASGFRLHYFRDLEELRPVVIDGAVPLREQRACPACGGALATLVTLLAAGDAGRLRLGYCSACGYRGYRDRPTPEWFRDFYREQWDNAQIRNAAAEAKHLKPWLSQTQRASVELAARIVEDRGRPLVEIGCGLGSALKEFEARGFRNIIGVEPSRFRSEVARAAYGYRVLTGLFEDEAVQASLREAAPVGVFYSFHALEHAYDPAVVIAAAAALQREGDMFVLAVPNGEAEAPVMTLFWLPHLHAFTSRSLSELFRRNGYEIVSSATAYPSHLIVAARRTSHPAAGVSSAPIDPVPSIREHFRLDRLEPGRRYRLAWKKKTYRTAFGPAPSSRAVDRLLQAGERIRNVFAAHLLGRFYTSRSLVMSALGRRYTDPTESPLEVQFDGPIELLVR
ncbi:MAG: methyltransferase domain-containing protein, partial [bacterium]|nr:methyltransferase domain-containing protein [bacterium]